MLQLGTVKHDAVEQRVSKAMPEHMDCPKTLRIEALEERLAPAVDYYLKIK